MVQMIIKEWSHTVYWRQCHSLESVANLIAHQYCTTFDPYQNVNCPNVVVLPLQWMLS